MLTYNYFPNFVAIMDSIVQFFVDWGCLGLFLSALVAGSILPFSSEAVMVVLVGMGLDPLLCLLVASIGNTLGGMTCYWIGTAGKSEWIHRCLHVDRQRLARAEQFLRGRGAVMGFFAFLPYIGEALAVMLGMMRSNALTVALSMFAGKALRYAAVLGLFRGVAALF